MPLIHWLQLSLTDGIGPVLIGRMVELSGSAENATSLTQKELQQIEGIGTGKAAGIADSLRTAAADAEQQMRKAAEFGASIICRDDESYPQLLRPLTDAPVVLYVKGMLQPRDL